MVNASKSVSFKHANEGDFVDSKNRTLNALDGQGEGSLTQEQPSPEPIELKKRLPAKDHIQVEVQQEQARDTMQLVPAADDGGEQMQAPEQLDIQVNAKAMNGGAHPDRHALPMNEMIIDPLNADLEQFSNPIDYFNIYRQKMKELARQRFDREKDR